MKAELIIEWYGSDGDPRLPRFRRLLRAALLAAGRPPCWQEYYAGWDNVPPRIGREGRAVLLVDGSVVWREGMALPEAEALTSVFLQPQRRRGIRWKQVARTHFSFFMAVVIAFFPKCPFCWAAYMSALSSLGLSTIPYRPWMLPLLIGLFFANMVSLYYTRGRHGYKLLLISLAGAVLIVGNRLYWNMSALLYAGAALLAIASLWNSLPDRMLRSLSLYFSRKD